MLSFLLFFRKKLNGGAAGVIIFHYDPTTSFTRAHVSKTSVRSCNATRSRCKASRKGGGGMIRDRFLKTIQKFQMMEKGETVFIAVSSGCDSTVLLYLLNELRTSWKLTLGILHVNHQLRGKESDQDEVFVRRLGRRLRLPVYVGRVDVKRKAKEEKISLEEAARLLRYEFFEKVIDSKQVHKLALAHNQDDQAETVLMRLITGTGLQGLQAIRPKRKLISAYLIRPLIEISRAEIRQFAKSEKIRFREDSSNRSLKFMRNRIRLKLLPGLERSFNPQVKKALARLPHLLDVDLAFLEETAELFYRRLARQKAEGEIVFPKQPFLQLRPSIQYRLIGRALRLLADAELDFDHWNAFLDHLSTRDRFRLQFPKGMLASVTPQLIRLMRRKKSFEAFSYLLSEGEELYIPEIKTTFACQRLRPRPRVLRKTDKSFELFDAGKLSFPLIIRSRKPGNKFQPLGQTKPLKLKGFLINKRIPQEDRDRLPLVVSGDTIVWVAGVAMGEFAKVSPKTRQFVRISFKQEK